MRCLWNERCLERPPRRSASTSKIDVSSLGSSEVRKSFLSALRTAIRDLHSQDALHVETAILGRLVYRMKTKFRSDKGLKSMEKMKRALLGYSSLALSKEYRRLEDCVRIDDQLLFLPSKQMLQYVLVRTQSFAKLTCRVENVARHAANFFKTRIELGHAWTTSLVAYAVLARIWTLSRYLIERCCIWYGNVRRYSNACRTVGAPWLPKSYDLPTDLRVWLDLGCMGDETKSVSPTRRNEAAVFGLLNGHGDGRSEEGDSELDVEEESSPVDVPSIGTTFELSNVTEIRSSVPTSDIGRPIDRHAFESNLATKVLPRSEISSARKRKATVVRAEDPNNSASKACLEKEKKRNAKTFEAVRQGRKRRDGRSATRTYLPGGPFQRRGKIYKTKERLEHR